MNATAAIPSQLREKTFRVYEPYIQEMLSAYPDSIKFVTAIHQPTFVARMRDAKISLRLHLWPTYIDLPKFLKLYDKLRIIERPDGVYGNCAPARDLPPRDNPLGAVEFTNSGSIHLQVTTLEEKKLLALLASRRLLTQPLLLTGLSLDDVKFLGENYDIIIEPTTDNKYKLQ